MVNNLINVSAFQGAVPADIAQPGVDRTIPGGPLYEPQRVITLIRSDEGRLHPWTKKCVKDLRDKLSLDLEGAAELICEAVISGGFRKSEWCRGNNGTHWAACDSYVLKREEYIHYARKDIEIEYYIKFAIQKSGKLLLLISCHNPENRG